MSPSVDSALELALGLPPIERAELVERIMASFVCLDIDLGPGERTGEPTEIDAAWAREAEARIDAYEQGQMKSIPAEEVFRTLKG